QAATSGPEPRAAHGEDQGDSTEQVRREASEGTQGAEGTSQGIEENTLLAREALEPAEPSGNPDAHGEERPRLTFKALRELTGAAMKHHLIQAGLVTCSAAAIALIIHGYMLLGCSIGL